MTNQQQQWNDWKRKMGGEKAGSTNFRHIFQGILQLRWQTHSVVDGEAKLRV